MKLTKYTWILWTIIFIIVLTLANTIPFTKAPVYWIGLVCTIAMFCLCAIAFYRAFRKDGSLESKLLGWPIFKVGYTALAIQVVIGFALMWSATICPVWAAAIVEIAMFVITAVALTVKDAVREAVIGSESKIVDNTTNWKALRTRASAIAAETGHPDIKKLAEEMRYADPKPTSMDSEIAQMLEILSSYADAANIKKVLVMMEQRKALAKIEK